MDEQINAHNNLKAVCPYCKKAVAFSWVSHSDYNGSYISKNLSTYLDNKEGKWAMVECPSCENCVLIKMKAVPGSNTKFSMVKMSPTPLPTSTDQRIKEEVRTDIDEAKICLGVEAYRACAVMSRRALAVMCIDNGAKSKDSLEDQIKTLKASGMITDQIAKWADSIRWVANDAAHPGKEDVTPEDAQDILNLTEQLANIIYVMPAISQEKDKIHGKKNTTNTSISSS